MKTCPCCGKEYPDEVVVCAADKSPLVPAQPKVVLTRDEEHLRLLAIFHYVVAGLAALFALFPVFHLIFGLAMIFLPNKLGVRGLDQPPMFLMGLFFAIVAVIFITIGWTFAAFVLAAGRFLVRRKHYTFCLVMAGIECIFMPFGTALGALTIVTLVREPVRQLFEANPSATSPAGI